MARPEEVLARREQRQAEQVGLVRQTGCPVVSVTIVSPGPGKDDADARYVGALAATTLARMLTERGWPVRERLLVRAVTGPELLLAVEADPYELKRALVGLEDHHRLGRLWDLDLVAGLDPDGLPQVLGRSALGEPPRRCLVCPDPAAGCARSARHRLDEVLAARAALAAGARAEQADEAADLAVRAMLVEARLTPKPGLVDRDGSGSHRDMDLTLLERSAETLRPWLARCWLVGAEQPGQTEPLVDLGVRAERAMLQVTGGVNTHRGALFGLGLLVAALGWEESGQPLPRLPAALPRAEPTEPQAPRDPARAPLTASQPVMTRPDALPGGRLARLRTRVAALARPLLRGWEEQAAGSGSHGAAAYREHGSTGARGEAASGFATAAQVGLPAYRARLQTHGDSDDALRWALVAIMATSADTNLLARGGLTGLRFAQDWARQTLAAAPSPDALTYEMTRARAAFTERWLSPGGSADLLALTWLLDRLDQA
ncbi:MAG: citrate lyase holo-[acyl-carrier protein] synthase [Actinomycetia bacterium]|nr:citrate lyase holo-[acyl-carrier protein] synthase [Actinomycetes bacterium]